MENTYAGVDWTGSPDLKQQDNTVNLFGSACVAVSDVEAINGSLADLREQWGWFESFEFHGHEMTEAQLLHFAHWFCSESIYVFMVLFDKKDLATDTLLFNKPALLYPASARLVVGLALDVLPLKRIWLDQDVPEPRRDAFDTAIKRDARLRREGTRLNVKHRSSSTSSLIQLADVAAYLLQREERGSFQTAALSAQVRALWQAEGNSIYRGKVGDLRPYLP